MKFNEFISHPGILKAIEESGYDSPTPIQEKVIPKVLEGVDIRASAPTGTGKTASFILPSLIRLSTPSANRAHGPRVVVLVPTRELAIQVATEASKYSKHLQNIKTVCIYGGTPYPAQIKNLKLRYDILVATPGRLIDHMESGRIKFDRTELLILDEADRMLDMGFIEPVKQIAAALPKERQTLMFSATLKGSVMNLSKHLLKNPIEVSVEPDHTQELNIEQRLIKVDSLDHKYRIIDHLLNDPTLTQAVVFTSTKRQADKLVDDLCDKGHLASALHSGMNQKQRTRTITQMRLGQVRILVATDVAARGIDVPAITHVINFDLPMTTEDYVHRIGRTGRASASGIAITFVRHDDMKNVRRIEQFTGRKITPHSVPGLESKGKPERGYDDQNRGKRPFKSGGFRSKSGPRSFKSNEGPRAFRPRPDRGSFQSEEGSEAPRAFRPRVDREEGSEAPRAFRPRADRGSFQSEEGSEAPRAFRPRPERGSFQSEEGSEAPRAFRPRPDRGSFQIEEGSEAPRAFRPRADRGSFQNKGRPREERGSFQRDAFGTETRGGFRPRADRGSFAFGSEAPARRSRSPRGAFQSGEFKSEFSPKKTGFKPGFKPKSKWKKRDF